MTARDVIGFFEFFSVRKSGTFLHIPFGAISFRNHTQTWRRRNKKHLEKRENIYWRKFKQSSGETSPKLQISVACHDRTCPEITSAESCRGFLLYRFWRISPGIFLEDFSWALFSKKNEEKKSGDKIRAKIRRLKNKNSRKIRSAKDRP